MQYADMDNVDDLDNLAIQNSDNDLPGIATKIGLTLRKMFALKFNKARNMSTAKARLIGNALMQIVKSDKSYSELFHLYNVDARMY